MTTVLTLRNVSKHYAGPPEVTALDGVSLEVPSGQSLAVVGPSGSGKSTLLNIMGMLDTPTSGTVALDGQLVGDADERARAALRRDGIGFVFQAFHLLSDISVVENVELALLYRDGSARSDHRDTARSALADVGLGDHWEAVPRQLSGGQQQRVAIARAMAKQPRIVLMDEPTGNLDTASAADVMSVLDVVVASGATVIVITHDASLAAWAHRSVALLDGRMDVEAHA